jgi:CHAD domain-containing protein
MSPPPLDRHLSSILERRLEQLAEAMRDSRGDRSVEAVHDMRVASRRLRAFGVTFRELLGDKTRSRLEKKLKRVTRAVGALRDLDVQVGLLEERLAATTKELERAALEHLLEHLAVRRAEAARRAERRLGTTLDIDAISRLVRRAGREVNRGLSAGGARETYALRLLERLVADAAEQVASSNDADDPERLHRLRIDVKEIRYALELFEPVLGADFQVLYARAMTLQDLLGTHHDLVTLAEVVSDRGAELRQRHRDALVRGLDGVAEALSAEQEAVLRRFQSGGFDPDWWRQTLRHAVERD